MEEVKKPFPKEEELSEMMERLSELNAMLNMDEKGGENLLADDEIGENEESRPGAAKDIAEDLAETADAVKKPSLLERLKETQRNKISQEVRTRQKPARRNEMEL
jgi:hypothetical protein